MKRVMTVICCFTACLLLLPGCISVIDTTTPSGSKLSRVDNINLLVKIDLERGGILLDGISSIVSKDSITLTHACQQNPENSAEIIVLKFSGSNIRRISEDNYSMDYKIGLTIPMTIPTASGRNSSLNPGVQYVDAGSSSSINIKSGQPVYIYESNIYKIKLTVTRQ